MPPPGSPWDFHHELLDTSDFRNAVGRSLRQWQAGSKEEKFHVHDRESLRVGGASGPRPPRLMFNNLSRRPKAPPTLRSTLQVTRLRIWNLEWRSQSVRLNLLPPGGPGPVNQIRAHEDEHYRPGVGQPVQGKVEVNVGEREQPKRIRKIPATSPPRPSGIRISSGRLSSVIPASVRL